MRSREEGASVACERSRVEKARRVRPTRRHTLLARDAGFGLGAVATYRRLDDLAAAQAARAYLDSPDAAVDQRPHPLQIRLPGAARDVVRVADAVARYRAFVTNFTSSGHDGSISLFGWRLGLAWGCALLRSRKGLVGTARERAARSIKTPLASAQAGDPGTTASRMQALKPRPPPPGGARPADAGSSGRMLAYRKTCIGA